LLKFHSGLCCIVYSEEALDKRGLKGVKVDDDF
jgi:hypothetical protein